MSEENLNPNPVPSELTSQIPTSLSVVNVRTLATDLESLSQTGGSHPLPEVVNVEKLAPENEPRGESLPEPRPSNLKTILAWAAAILGLVALVLLGYFVLPLVLK